MAQTPLSPSYYKRGTAPVWDFIRDQGLSFHLGNAIKYICRAGYKGSKEEDLEKAIVYLQNELTHAKRQNLSRYNQDDEIVFTGSGVQGGLSDYELEFTTSPRKTADIDSGGVQGIFGSGGDALSFKSKE
jgi:hypothetical protein